MGRYPRDTVNVGLSYGFENLTTLQRSRQASPGVQFNDPTRDWSTDLDERVHTWTATLDLPRITSRTSAQAAYDFVHSNAQYLYLLPSNSTLPPVSQLPRILNEYHRATADLRYTLNRQLAIGGGYHRAWPLAGDRLLRPA